MVGQKIGSLQVPLKAYYDLFLNRFNQVNLDFISVVELQIIWTY